jgi:hypothetical protein
MSNDRAPDDGGLLDLLDLMDSISVPYWVDSGVLLSLYRDGGLLPWEKDIDLAVEGPHVEALIQRADAFEAAGYAVNVHRYRGRVYAVVLKPMAQRPPTDLRAAVHVYYRVGDYLVSPQTQIYVPPPAPDVHPGRRSPVGRAIRAAIENWLYDEEDAADARRVSRAPDNPSAFYRAARTVYRRLDRGMLAEIWPIREVFVPLTWVVPAELVLPRSNLRFRGRDLPVPGQIAEYLTYRYGDWSVPVSEWCYWEDDGAVVRDRPARVLRRLAAET